MKAEQVENWARIRQAPGRSYEMRGCDQKNRTRRDVTIPRVAVWAVMWLSFGAVLGCSGGDGPGSGPWELESGTPQFSGDASEIQDDTGGEIVCGEPDQWIESIDAARELAPCDVYRGSIRFEGNHEYENPKRFPDFRVIEGSLIITSAGNIENLRGMERLERLGKLILRGSSDFESFAGLSGLRRIDGEFEVKLAYIRNFRGLENMRSIGSARIDGNPDLESFDGLSGLRHVRGDFRVERTRKLTEDEIRTFAEDLQIDGEFEIIDY